MRWEVRKAWDGSCEWQVYDLGELGTLTVEEWEGKWIAAWEPSVHPWMAENIDSESAAKALVRDRIGLAISQLGNALEAGEPREDEE